MYFWWFRLIYYYVVFLLNCAHFEQMTNQMFYLGDNGVDIHTMTCGLSASKMRSNNVNYFPHTTHFNFPNFTIPISNPPFLSISAITAGLPAVQPQPTKKIKNRGWESYVKYQVKIVESKTTHL